MRKSLMGMGEATAYGSEGWRFESSRMRQLFSLQKGPGPGLNPSKSAGLARFHACSQADKSGQLRTYVDTQNCTPTAHRHRFRRNGRLFTIYRIDGYPWRTQFSLRGRRYHVSLETDNMRQAEFRAVDWIIRPVMENQPARIPRGGPEEDKPTPQADTLARVFSIYERDAVIAPRTIRSNMQALLLVVRWAKGAHAFRRGGVRRRMDLMQEADGVPLAELDAPLAMRFQSAMVRHYQRNVRGEGALRSARARALRTSRSLMRQARSVFKPAMLAVYAGAGVQVPDGVGRFCSARLEGSDRSFLRGAIPDNVVAQTFAGIGAVRDDRDLFVAFWLVAGFGLRRGEVMRLDWSDVKVVNGRWVVDGGIGKDGRPIQVVCQERAEAALVPFRQASGRVLDRPSVAVLRLNEWLRGMGWDNEKAMHDLRAYVGSLIFEVNPTAAMVWMRHKDLQTTQRYYSHHAKLGAVPQVL